MNKVSKISGIIASIYTICFSTMILLWFFRLIKLPWYYSVISDIYLLGGFFFSAILVVLGLISGSKKLKIVYTILGVIGLLLSSLTFLVFQ